MISDREGDSAAQLRMISDPDERSPALEVVGLEAFYGKSQVIFDLNLTVDKGETVTLLGRNGAGKTSTLLAIAGAIATRQAAIRLEGEGISKLPPYKRVRAGLLLAPSGSRAFPNLTVHENLNIGRSRKTNGGWTIEDAYAFFPRLAQLKNARGDQLSGGERQMLAVGRAMMGNPKVLMLDEPSEGLGPLIVREIGMILETLNKQGLSVLLTEQNYRLALQAADRAYFIEKGRVVWEGNSDAASHADVIRRYLGV